MKIRSYKENVLLMNPPVSKDFLAESFTFESDKKRPSVHKYDEKINMLQEFECNFNTHFGAGFFRYALTRYGEPAEAPKDRLILVPQTLLNVVKTLEPKAANVILDEFKTELETARSDLMDFPVNTQFGRSLTVQSRFDYDFTFKCFGVHIVMSSIEIKDPAYKGLDFKRTHYNLDIEDGKIQVAEQIIPRDEHYKMIGEERILDREDIALEESDLDLVALIKATAQAQIGDLYEFCKDSPEIKVLVKGFGEKVIRETMSKMAKYKQTVNSFYLPKEERGDSNIKNFRMVIWDGKIIDLYLNYGFSVGDETSVELETVIDPRIVDKIIELHPNDYDIILAGETEKGEYATVYESSECCTLRRLPQKEHYNVGLEFLVQKDKALIYSLEYQADSGEEKSEATRVFLDENDEVQVETKVVSNSFAERRRWTKDVEDREKRHEEERQKKLKLE